MLNELAVNQLVTSRTHLRILCIQAIRDNMPNDKFYEQVDRIVQNMDTTIKTLNGHQQKYKK